jgi:DNA-binding XRE family transcriptional regulator
MKSKNNKKVSPSESWDSIRKQLNINLEQEAEIQLEIDIINATIAARKKNKLTQTELAEKTGLTQSVIARFEKNKNSPRIDTTIKMLLPMGYTLRVVPIDKSKITVQ